jgi:6-pyruvoyltetrahydropterin/6-carboxytetrahydropterin synthase
MAHAIYGYAGACKNIHGHSYELHVTVSTNTNYETHIPAPGFVSDFKEIKNIVTKAIIDTLDHKVVLSEAFLLKKPSYAAEENLVTWAAEPTAENMLLYIKHILNKIFPPEIKLVYLKLFETKDSYAEWFPDTTFTRY